MARKYEIGVAIDTGAFEKGVSNGLIDPLDEAADAFDDLEKAARNADLDKELDKARKATDKLDDELDDTREALEKLKHRAKDVGDSSESAFGSAAENAEEFKNEALQNFSEVTSSFDGSMESILDLAQGTLGGLASGISGPLGLALGLAAAGIGLVVNGFIEGEERAEELREQAREFAVEAVNAGKSTEAWLTGAEQIITRIQELEQLKATDWRWFWEKDPTQLQKWTDGLAGTGRSLDEVESFLKSSTDAQNDYLKSVKRSQDVLYDEIQLRRESVDITNQAEVAKTQALVDEYEAGQDLLDMLNQEVTVRDEASASADRQRDAGVDSARARMEAEEEAAQAIEAAQQIVQDSVTSAYDNMRDAATEYATTEDGALDISRWLEYTQEHAAAVATYQANLEAIRLSPEQWSNLMEMPEDARAQWVAQFAALPEDARAPYAAALNNLGATGGSEAAVAFDDAFTPDASVTIDADTTAALAALDDVVEDREVTIDAALTGEAAVRSSLDTLTKKRTVSLEARLDTTKATADMDAWRRTQEQKPIRIRKIVTVEGEWD
jgi:hypothetical protein